MINGDFKNELRTRLQVYRIVNFSIYSFGFIRGTIISDTQ